MSEVSPNATHPLIHPLDPTPGPYLSSCRLLTSWVFCSGSMRANTVARSRICQGGSIRQRKQQSQLDRAWEWPAGSWEWPAGSREWPAGNRKSHTRQRTLKGALVWSCEATVGNPGEAEFMEGSQSLGKVPNLLGTPAHLGFPARLTRGRRSEKCSHTTWKDFPLRAKWQCQGGREELSCCCRPCRKTIPALQPQSLWSAQSSQDPAWSSGNGSPKSQFPVGLFRGQGWADPDPALHGQPGAVGMAP